MSSHSLLASLLFPTCVHSLLECLGFAWCILIVVPMLCPFHNMVCARTRLVVAMNTQALCPKVMWMHDGWMVDDLLSEGYPFHSQFLCTTWLNPNVLALSGFCISVPLLSVLMHGCFKDSPGCCHEYPNQDFPIMHGLHILLSVYIKKQQRLKHQAPVL